MDDKTGPSRARSLDDFLDAYTVPEPSAALVGRIIASAYHPKHLWSRAQIWWSGLGFAGIGLAGAVAGALAITVALPAMVPHHGGAFADEQATAFDNVDVGGDRSMSSRTLRIALIISVVINIFVLGGLAGAAIMWKRAAAERPMVGFGRPARLRQAAEALTPDDRMMLRQAIRATVLSLRPEIHNAREARREAGEILIRPDYDPPAMNAALARARASDFAVRTRLEQSVVMIAEKLPQAERQALATGLMRAAARPMRQPSGPPEK